MAKKLTITAKDEVYADLHSVSGRRRISRFLNDLARPRVTGRDLPESYRAIAADAERERGAAEWVENSPATRRMNPDRTPRRSGPVAPRNGA